MKRFFGILAALVAIVNVATAREVISINDNWKFYFGVENSADYARTISLPHTWDFGQSNLLVSSQPTTANYMRQIYVPQTWDDKRIFIKFYGVQNVADVMVNGSYVGEHRGGATAFTFEITKFLKAGDNNKLHVLVNNNHQSDILPTSNEEDIYGGIYRDVELIVTDKTAVSPLYYGTEGVLIESKAVSAEQVEGVAHIHLNSTNSNHCQVVLAISNPTGEVVFHKSLPKAKVGEESASIPFIINKPQLWSLEEPQLYTFNVNVITDDSSDKVKITSGFRSIDYSGNGYIKINGVPTQFRGVALYHDYPHVGGAATKRDIDTDIELVDEVGANAIRSVSHPHAQYLYDLCDKQGRLAWIDFPLTKAPFLSDIAYFPTERFHNQGRETLKEIILQNYNHPSVVMWGVFSLLTTRGDNPIPYIKELNKLAKRLDPSRPTVAVSDQDGEINGITDLVVWNQNLGWNKGQFSDVTLWSKMLHERWSNFRSAVIYGQNGRIDQQSEAAEYKSTNLYNASSWKPEGRQRVFHEEYAARVATDSLFWGVCVNSMFDFKSSRNSLGENNSGMVSFDRRSKKDIFQLYKAKWNTEEKVLHIADKRNGVRSSAMHRVTVYATDTIAPQIFTLRDTIKMRRIAPAQFTADSVMLQRGENKIIVRQGDAADSTVVTLENPSEIPLMSKRAR